MNKDELRKKLNKLAIVCFVIAIIVFIINYFVFHYVTDDGITFVKQANRLLQILSVCSEPTWYSLQLYPPSVQKLFATDNL